jgi:hypothetical protein
MKAIRSGLEMFGVDYVLAVEKTVTRVEWIENVHIGESVIFIPRSTIQNIKRK